MGLLLAVARVVICPWVQAVSRHPVVAPERLCSRFLMAIGFSQFFPLFATLDGSCEHFLTQGESSP